MSAVSYSQKRNTFYVSHFQMFFSSTYIAEKAIYFTYKTPTHFYQCSLPHDPHSHTPHLKITCEENVYFYTPEIGSSHIVGSYLYTIGPMHK